MATALKATCFLQLQKKPQDNLLSRPSNPGRITIPARTAFKPPMATLSTVPTVGLSETFTRLRKQGKVSIPFLIPHLSKICFVLLLGFWVLVFCCFIALLGISNLSTNLNLMKIGLKGSSNHSIKL